MWIRPFCLNFGFKTQKCNHLLFRIKFKWLCIPVYSPCYVGKANSHVTITAFGDDFDFIIIETTRSWYAVCRSYGGCVFVIVFAWTFVAHSKKILESKFEVLFRTNANNCNCIIRRICFVFKQCSLFSRRVSTLRLLILLGTFQFQMPKMKTM